MQADLSLDDARDKLRWAKVHFEALRLEVEAFEQRDTHTITCHVDPDVGQYTFRVRGLEPPAPDWGLRIGDCVHNARCALDHLMVRIVAIATGQAPRDLHTIGFPIFDTPAGFAGAAKIAKENPVLSGYFTRIEELQPYNVGNISIWGVSEHRVPYLHALPFALQRLALLDNVDKHRAIHAAWVGSNTWHDQRFSPPPGFIETTASTTMAPLHDDAEIGTRRYAVPLPSLWEPSQVEMKRCFPIKVAMGEPLIFNGVVEILALCLWGVGAVIQIFDPVFSSIQPPLPVTSIPNVH